MHEYKINAGAGFVFGHWEETEEDIHETYRWILKNYAQKKLMNHEVNVLTPMPGTPVWHWAEKQGHPVSETQAVSVVVILLKDRELRIMEEKYNGRYSPIDWKKPPRPCPDCRWIVGELQARIKELEGEKYD